MSLHKDTQITHAFSNILNDGNTIQVTEVHARSSMKKANTAS
jgi:hypothetical protein